MADTREDGMGTQTALDPKFCGRGTGQHAVFAAVLRSGPMRSFQQKVAVITGAGSGIGRGLAVALAEQGSDLALADIDEQGLERTAEQVRARSGSSTTVSLHRVDVADRSQMEALPEAVQQTHGRADIVVNNAGVSVSATFEEHTIEDLEWIIGINLWGVIYGCKFFLPLLRGSDDAYIVNLSSMFGLIGVPRQASYCTTKFAVRGLSEALAMEMKGSNIGVLSVHPGGIATNIARSSRWRGEGGPDRDRVVRFFDERAMPPERAAALILKAMRRRQSRLVITPEARLADVLVRALPSAPRHLIVRVQDLLFR